ncbi:MAG: NrdH-redoxin [Candidatus Doudnabacteria bacterium RIFCSPHIGHO2_01_FULL_46_14]|uniref:NrdH-redoxin n=1 Tax=Candidatus Doudnabacteria bacterium RIFCSPHIGHO2_01_FULL_46_14 TaxID=1817824 RepID=A0A1F5NJR5_9BACT|nr:MAG: NrdH-redoxin [Candidatus Doudnabacteria bacterium RIFCSPHIGHO2_01_FULL_46_14]
MAKPVIYTTFTCPFCKMAKAFFKEKGVEYEEKDVTHDEVLQQEMIKKSGQFAVPVIDLGGTIIVGFQKEKIEAALGGEK